MTHEDAFLEPILENPEEHHFYESGEASDSDDQAIAP